MNQRPLAAIPLTCPVSVPSCKSSSSPGYQRLDTANASKPNTVKGMELMLEACSILPGLGFSCSVVNIIIKAGSGDISGAGEELLFAGLPGSKLLRGVDDAAEVVQYTKSTLRLGQQMHKAYRATEHAPDLGRFKEFTGITGIRPDFVDFNTRTIYELKPFNPRGLKSGAKQLEKYRKAFEKTSGGNWKTVLDTY